MHRSCGFEHTTQAILINVDSAKRTNVQASPERESVMIKDSFGVCSSGRGAFCKPLKVVPGGYAGGIRSANADMSNDNAGEKPARRKTKGSYPMLIRVG